MLQINASLILLALLTAMCHTGRALLEYNSFQLRSLNRPGLQTSQAVTTHLTEAGILKKPATRGTTAGKKHYSHIQVVSTSWSITQERNHLDTSLKQTGVGLSNLTRVKRTTADQKARPQVHFCIINARSVKNKPTTIYQLIIDNDIDILVITETWLHPGDADGHVINALTPPGYTLQHVARPSGYGGVAIVYKSSLTVSIKEDAPTGTTFESLCLNLTSDHGTDSLCAIY